MSRKPRGCRYKLVGIMGSGVDIVVLGVARRLGPKCMCLERRYKRLCVQ